LDLKSGTQLIKRYRGTIGKGARNELLLILYETSVNFKIYRSLLVLGQVKIRSLLIEKVASHTFDSSTLYLNQSACLIMMIDMELPACGLLSCLTFMEISPLLRPC
jgi:hypothetical protein